MAEHYDVSRTVARDVLSRLQERGLVRKNQSSHWVAGPLTAKDIHELYELRSALEPLALRSVATHASRENLEACRESCNVAHPEDCAIELIDRIEFDLHESLLLATRNDQSASRSVAADCHRALSPQHRPAG